MIIEDRLGGAMPEETTMRTDGFDVGAATGRTMLTRQLRNPLVTVKYASSANINLNNAGNAIDGAGFLLRDRVLLKAQTVASENGVYYVASQRPTTVLWRLTSLDALPSYRVSVRAGTTHASTQWLKSSSTAFIAAGDIGDPFLEVDIDDYYLEADGWDHLQAFSRAQDALDDGGTITFNRRVNYTFSSALTIKKKICLRGHSTLNLASATRLNFNGSHGIHAVFGRDPGFPDASGGWSIFQGLWLSYKGSNLEENNYHGFFLETPVIIRECTIDNFPGHGLHVVANTAATPPSGANLIRLFSMRIYVTGLSGVYLAGNDANASVAVGVDVTGCGVRRSGCVKAQYTLTLTDKLGRGATIIANQWVFSDKRYSLYYIARTGGILPPMGRLNIIVEAYDNSLDLRDEQGYIKFGSGSQYGYGTEYNLPAAHTIENIVHPLPTPEGVCVTNLTTASQVALPGDAHGIWDESFLGNTWIGCHVSASGCRHYLANKKSSGSTFVGCYTEIGNFGEVAPPNMRIGGMWADPPGMQSSGLQRNTFALQLNDTIWKTEGPRGVVVRRARHNTNEIDHFYTDADRQGYKFEQGLGGATQNTYAWQHQGSGAYSALGLTQPAHPRNRGHAIAPRGIITGNPGMRIGSGEMPPAQSDAENVWNKGDTWYVVKIQGPAIATGDPWLYVCTAKAPVSGTTYDLTWTVMMRWP